MDAASGIKVAELVLKVGAWAGEMIIALIRGDEGPEPARLAAILPPQLKADVEHERQRQLLAREIREDEAKRRGDGTAAATSSTGTAGKPDGSR